ncbi:MAG: hypothetical protein ACI4JM_05640 [Oscillospiraceae bacterium]
MTLKEKRAIDQKTINDLAKQYCEYKKSGNSGQAKAVKWQICEKIIVKGNGNALSYSLYSKCMEKFGFNENDAYDVIQDVFLKSINEYDYDKNDNFTAYMEKQVFYECSHRKSKEYITKKGNSEDDKIPRYVDTYTYNEDGELYDDMESVAGSECFYDKTDCDNLRAKRVKLVSCVAKFEQTRSKKEANPTRLSYFKIFVTEAITKDINQSKNYDDYNTGELPDVMDGNYVRFFAFTDFISAADLIDIKMKKYSDILENGEEKEIKLNMEPRVIIPYRVQAGLDKKAVNPANVSQQKEKYIEFMKNLLAEI